MSAIQKAGVAAALAAALLAGALVWITVSERQLPRARSRPPLVAPREGPRPTSAREAQPLRDGAPIAPDQAQRGPSLTAQPRPSVDSLRGTDADGVLATDARGHLALSPDVRHRFDWWLSAQGEESLDAIRARVQAEAARLGSPAGPELADLFERYLRYRESGRSLGALEGDPERVHAAVRDLRREALGEAAAAALWRDQDALDTAALERRRMLADDSLSAAERARREAQIEASLPADLRAARAAATEPARLDAEEAAMRAAGATPDEIQAARVQASGPEAAARLSALDAARALWNDRLQAYRDRRAQLLAQGGADRVDALLAELFTPQEQLRVRVLAP